MVAYFIRRSRDACAVVKLYPDDREEIVQDGLSLIEAEILCAMKIEDLPRPPAPHACSDDPRPRSVPNHVVISVSLDRPQLTIRMRMAKPGPLMFRRR
jgi:hypothetical protein